jgi:hypothetical protein
MATQTLAEKLSEAESAYHNLQTGVMPRVVVDQNGQRVEFTAANKADLYRYILDLKAQLPDATLDHYPGPAQFLF